MKNEEIDQELTRLVSIVNKTEAGQVTHQIEKIKEYISTIRREAVEGFVDECLEDSALLDEEIGIDTAMVKQKRWVNIDKLKDLASDYLKDKTNE